MKETAERMDSALSFSLAGEEELGRKMFAQNQPVFRDSLHAELGNITVPGERELAEALQQAHEKYAARAEVFWATTDPEERRKMYFGEMLPSFTRIKDTAQEVIRINENNMVQADREARGLAAQSTHYMIIDRRRPRHRRLFRRAAAAVDPTTDTRADRGLERARRRKARPGRAGHLSG